MFKIIQHHSKLVVISRLSQAFEVKIENAPHFYFSRRNYHILKTKPRYHLFTSCSVTNNYNKSGQENRFIVSGLAGIQSAANYATTDNLPAAPVAPPAPIEETIAQIVQTSINGEPTFASLGLGGWSPAGMVQTALECLHVTMDIPWWGVIMIGTICVRICVFPLVILAQRNNAKMNNHLPEIQHIQLKMSEARQTGNTLDAARYGHELMRFMSEKGLNPIKNMWPPLAQAPIFISFFIGLRGMANCPVESMMTGGLFWFTDLTLPDQYYLLPLLTSLTLAATIEIGTDAGRMNTQNAGLVKYILRALPIVMFPFTINFSGAILCYWLSTNIVSLGQVAFLRIPAVRDYLKIPKLISHSSDKLPIKNKGFIKGAKESWTNMKLSRELEDRQRVDEMVFNRAGKGPIQKTYKYDPTKSMTAISAKKSQS